MYFINREFGKVLFTLVLIYVINAISSMIIGTDDWLLIFENIFLFSDEVRFYEWSYYTYSFKNILSVIAINELFDPVIIQYLDLIITLVILTMFAFISVIYTFYNETDRENNKEIIFILLILLILALVRNAGGYALLLLFVFYKRLLHSKYPTFLVFIATFPIDILIAEPVVMTHFYSFIGGEYHFSNKGLYLGMLLRPLSLLLMFLYFFNYFLNEYVTIRSSKK